MYIIFLACLWRERERESWITTDILLHVITAYVSIYIYIYIYIYIHTHMHAYIHTYIHTYVHTKEIVLLQHGTCVQPPHAVVLELSCGSIHVDLTANLPILAYHTIKQSAPDEVNRSQQRPSTLQRRCWSGNHKKQHRIRIISNILLAYTCYRSESRAGHEHNSTCKDPILRTPAERPATIITVCPDQSEFWLLPLWHNSSQPPASPKLSQSHQAASTTDVSEHPAGPGESLPRELGVCLPVAAGEYRSWIHGPELWRLHVRNLLGNPEDVVLLRIRLHVSSGPNGKHTWMLGNESG